MKNNILYLIMCLVFTGCGISRKDMICQIRNGGVKGCSFSVNLLTFVSWLILTAYESDYSQENADICYLKLALNNDYESFWNRVYSYADKNIKSY